MPYEDLNLIQDPTISVPLGEAWFDQVRTNEEFLARNKPSARVYNNAAISINTSTVTALTFNSERYDVGGCHDTSSLTSRLKVPTGEGGVFFIGGGVQWGAHVTGYRSLLVRLNGSVILAQIDALSIGAAVMSQTIATMYALAAGDYVELCVWQTSGVSLNVNVAGNYSPEFHFMWQSM